MVDVQVSVDDEIDHLWLDLVEKARLRLRHEVARLRPEPRVDENHAVG